MSIIMKWIPYERIGHFIFGMHRSEIKKMLGESRATFMYGYPVENRFLDDYNDLHTLCNQKQLLEAIEFFPDILQSDVCIQYHTKKIYITSHKAYLITQIRNMTDDIHG